MGIMHMPYGMREGDGCGFARVPVLPLAGGEARVYARLEKDAATPLLFWRVEGAEQAPVAAEISCRAGDDRVYACFVLPMPSAPARVAYQIRAGEERTGWFAFESLAARRLDLRAEGGLTLTLTAGEIRAEGALSGATGAGGAENCVFFDEVKRFTDGGTEMLPQAVAYCDRTGKAWMTECAFLLRGVRVYGLGERFDGVDQQDKALSLRVEEYFGTQAEHSYLPVPLLFTEGGVGLLIDTLATVHMRFERRGERTLVTVQRETRAGEGAFNACLLRGEPCDMLHQYHARSGKPALPPRWALGIWMSANGWNSQREALYQWEMCQRYDLPATALVLEAWSDEKTFYVWNDAEYAAQGGEKRYTAEDFRFPAEGKWPDPAAMIARLDAAGIKTVLWQIPVIKRAWEGSCPQLDADEAYAIARGYCVRCADGTPYRISDGWFSGSLLLDCTNPQACAWWFGKRRYLLDMGVAGFKTDGGEFLFDHEAVLADGTTGSAAHNAYPLRYIAAYARFGGVTFSRAGYSGAQTMPIHWAGDQWSTWDALRAQVSAGLSAGLSGIPFWSFDMAGFAGPLPDAELYLRALAVAAFCPVMQWHSEPRAGQYAFTAESRALNDRSPWNIALQTGDARVLPRYRALTKLRMRLMDYIYEEAAHCAQSSRPLMAHLIVDFPRDANVWDIGDEYLFGRSLLAAPVLTRGARERRVYLPAGRWQELFTGAWHAGGQWIVCPCEAGRALIFAKENHAAFYKLFQEA